MRSLFTIAIVAFSLVSSAQDWALINPAYRYNYSDDGTDTISNQIRVMHIDTLGPDSFRYELNRVAVKCDDCDPDCRMRVDQPQFLQLECVEGPLESRFIGPGEFVIRPRAALQETWVFDATNNVHGQVIDISGMTVHGVPDTVKTMVTPNMDTVRWSLNYGILDWILAGESHYTLIGVHGPDIGELIPSLNEFIPYYPGDVVQYSSFYLYTGHIDRTYTRCEITGRVDSVDQVSLSRTCYSISIPHNGQVSYSSTTGVAILDRSNVEHRPLLSWPGELVSFDGFGPLDELGTPSIIAKHGKDNERGYTVDGERIDYSTIFFVQEEPVGACQVIAITPGSKDVYLGDTQIGPRVLMTNDQWYEGYGISTTGAIIAGEIVGYVENLDFFHVGFGDRHLPIGKFHPNPANDKLNIPQSLPRANFVVHDAQGRSVISGRIPTTQQLDLIGLQEGTYFLTTEGFAPQRFMIIR